MQFSKVNGVNMHYQLIGAHDKPVLVFVNELGTDFRIWRDVIVQLVGQFSIVLYDMRGHGLSDGGNGDYSLDAHVEDLAALVTLLKVEKAAFCGAGLGGLIAQGLYHSDHRRLVRAMILCSASAKACFEFYGKPVREQVQDWFHGEGDAADLRGYETMLARADCTAVDASLSALEDVDFTDRVKQIGVPMLGVAGVASHDRTLDFVKQIAGAHYESVKGGGACLPVHKPHELSDILSAFCGTL